MGWQQGEEHQSIGLLGCFVTIGRIITIASIGIFYELKLIVIIIDVIAKKQSICFQKRMIPGQTSAISPKAMASNSRTANVHQYFAIKSNIEDLHYPHFYEMRK